MPITLSIALALVIDRLLGEPRKFHPLVMFGAVASRMERMARARLDSATSDQLIAQRLRRSGGLCWALLVSVPPLFLLLVQSLVPGWLAAVIGIIAVYVCIGWRSLVEHAQAIQTPLLQGDIDAGRLALAMIVSRDTATLNTQEVSQAAVESLLENGSDALIAPLFWFVLAGAPGALCYRLCNTLDAMWGYRNEKYREFGAVAARADDIANRLPSVFCALAYGCTGQARRAFSCWSRQGPDWDSPNAGPVMAAGAGALGLHLGGSAAYAGQVRSRPQLGNGRSVYPADIHRALALVWRSLLLCLLLVALAECVRWI